MAGLSLERARTILERTGGCIPNHYGPLPADQFQSQLLVDLGYHEVLGQDGDEYKAKSPRLTHQPRIVSGIWTPLLIDPRIPMEEVVRRGYILRPTTYEINLEDLIDVEPSPEDPYWAFFSQGNPDYSRPVYNGKPFFRDYERPARAREIAQFALISPFIGERYTHLKAAGTVYGQTRLFAGIVKQPGRQDPRFELDYSHTGLASCVRDAELIPV
jgi:hypothetical protein